MNTAARRPLLDPYAVQIPEELVPEIDDLVNAVSARLGEPPADVRRGVEITILKRGIAALRGAEGKR